MFVLALCPSIVFAKDSSSAVQANKKTALRCLTLAKNYAADLRWEKVETQARLGISYDDGVSDLWYMLALSSGMLGKSKAETVSASRQALELDAWVDYNRDACRILCADFLSDVRDFDEVFRFLDGKSYSGEKKFPYLYIYSADAEYVRAKTFYRMNTEESRAKALEKVEYARKTYPSDLRFAELFFAFENPDIENARIQKVASYYINEILKYYSEENADLELLAARFAGSENRERILRAFNGRGAKHYLYASQALQQGMINEAEAFRYFRNFADAEIDYEAFVDFFAQITDDKVRADVSDYVRAYSGTILRDTDGDLIPNLAVRYSRGRPQKIIYDSDQDGISDWEIICDYGVPVRGSVTADAMDFYWDVFPYISTVFLKTKNEHGVSTELMSFVPGDFAWTPIRMESDGELSLVTGAEVFFPLLNEYSSSVNNGNYVSGNTFGKAEADFLTLEKLVANAHEIVVPSSERDNAKIKFTMSNGLIAAADYTENGVLYARAQFEKGEPVLRVIDSNCDGEFETTEFYAEDSDGSMEVYSFVEEESIMRNLFGVPSAGKKYYLRMVQVDTAGDGDSVPDFTEEYFPRGGKISSWDTDGDGKWDVRSVTRSTELNADGTAKPREEESSFYNERGQLVTVTSVGGVPVSVVTGEESFAVVRDVKYNFYWIGRTGTSEESEKVLRELKDVEEQGKSIIVDFGNERVIGIRVGTMNYGMFVAE